MPDPFGEAADEAEGAPGGDIGADNPAEYGDVLRITPSILAPKVEFNVSACCRRRETSKYP